MLRIIAMVGDAEASAHLREAVEEVAHLQFVCDIRALSQCDGRELPDVLVLGVKEAELPSVGAVMRDATVCKPSMRFFLVCRRDGPNLQALMRVQHLGSAGIILPCEESPAQTRRALLAGTSAEDADRSVRRLLCSRAPDRAMHYLHWCVSHDGAVRPSVRALAAAAQVRPETLVRRFTALGLCLPNHLIAWVLLLRARARLDRPQASFEAVAHELGLGSGGSLANLIKRRTGLTRSEFRARKLEDIAASAVREMFGASLERAFENPTRPIDRSAS